MKVSLSHKLLICLALVIAIALVNSAFLAKHHARIDFIEAVRPESGALLEESIGEANTENAIDAKRENNALTVIPKNANRNYEWRIYVCGDEAHAHDENKRLIVNNYMDINDQVMPGESFSIAPRKSWNLKGNYGTMTNCHAAGNAEVGSSYEIRLDEGEYAIRLESEKLSGVNWHALVVLSTLALLVAGLVVGWRRRGEMPVANLKKYDGIVVFVVGTIVAVVLASLASSLFSESDVPSLLPTPESVTASNLGMFLGLFGTSVAFLWFRRDKHKTEAPESAADSAVSSKPLTRICRLHPMVFAPIAGFVLAIFGASVILIANDVEMTTFDLANEFSGYRLSLAHFAMTAAISEELFYRGVIQESIGGKETSGRRAWIGICVAAFLFALVHVPQSTGHLYSLLPVASVGFVSGIVKQKTQTIFPSMTMHLTYNTALLIPSLFV